VPGASWSACTSRVASPYSSAYDSASVSPGSFPAFRTRRRPAPAVVAAAAANAKPRASTPATTSNRPANGATSSAATVASAGPSASTGVRSTKRMPGVGKSGITRASASIAAAAEDVMRAPYAARVAGVLRALPRVTGGSSAAPALA